MTEPSKSSIRLTYITQRLELPNGARAAAAESVYHAFFKALPMKAGEGVIAGYWPIQAEVDDMPILKRLMARRHVCALPCTGRAGTELVFRVWDPKLPMVRGAYDIPEPDGPEILPDVIIIPMAAFDGARNRLGYGGGFYDRTLAALKAKKKVIAVGLAYQSQFYPSLPVEENDVKMDIVITDKKVYK